MFSRIIIAAVAASAFLTAGLLRDAHALTTLKKVQVTDGSRIDLFFDQEVSGRQIRTEYFRDIIQLSLKDVSVYPAKITSVSGMDLTKVFAYQYTPRLVRTRLSVKGEAENYKERVTVESSGKRVTIRIKDGTTAKTTEKDSDSIRHTAASAANAQNPGSAPAAQKSGDGAADARNVKISGEKEQALFKKVMGEKSDSPTERLTGGKPLPSPLKPFGVLAALLAVIGGVFALVKKAKGSTISRHKGIGRMFSNLGISPKQRMIEVVSSHHLGPKKSIAMVRVAGRMLVLGVTNESINLISELPAGAQDSASDEAALDEKEIIGEVTGGARGEAGLPASGATAAGPSVFSDLLALEGSKPGAHASTKNNGARQRIRSRLEGLKPL